MSINNINLIKHNNMINLGNNGKLVSSQDEKFHEITKERMKKVLLNNKYYQMNYDEINKFLDSKIDFGKYKKGSIINLIGGESFNIILPYINEIKNFTTYNGDYKITDIYDFTSTNIKIKDKWKEYKQKEKAKEIIENIFNNSKNILLNQNNKIKDVFIVNEKGYTWKDVLTIDPEYINVIIDKYDFSDPMKNLGIFKYYTNKNNIEKFINGEITKEDIENVNKNKLSSFEIEIGGNNYLDFYNYFKDKGFIFLDTETTNLDIKTGSLLSFGYVKYGYNEELQDFTIIDKGEIFIQDIKQPITELSSSGGAFGKYSGNKITEKIIKEKGLEPIIAGEKIRNIIEGEYVFAHNASFDMEVLNLFFCDIKKDIPLVNKFFDTYSDVFPFYFKIIPEYQQMSRLGLDELSKKILGEDISKEAERHTSLKDALWSGNILLKLINNKEVRKNNDYSKFNIIDKNLDFDTKKIKLY